MSLTSYPAECPLMLKQKVFFVTDELQKLLDNLPADEPRSRLEPFRTFILRWRREGRSYPRIQQILAVQCKVQVSSEAVRKFVRSRSRPRKLQPEPEIEQQTSAPASEPIIQAASTTGSKSRRSPEETAAARAALRAAYAQPVFSQEETKPLFVRDPSKRIRNLNNEGEN